MKHLSAKLAMSVAFVALAGPVAAQSAGDFTIGLGFASVAPKSDNGTVNAAEATISENTQLSLTAEYFIRDNLGIEILAATPFSHNIYLDGVASATTKHLPPTVSLKYHFPTGGALTPFVGLGVNYTVFFEDDIAGGDLRLKNSWGLAAAAGVDYQISDTGAMRLEVRYMDIDSEVFLDGASIGTAHIDPFVFNVGYVHRF
ncbi:OmpW/AlkL family protein [Aliiroseovarius sp.]|uniref:OmpW/AlkL family protein n=1 Tax=Aliiroseovarius sp. TaxID=1872442 RepID=UPI003BAC127D